MSETTYEYNEPEAVEEAPPDPAGGDYEAEPVGQDDRVGADELIARSTLLEAGVPAERHADVYEDAHRQLSEWVSKHGLVRDEHVAAAAQVAWDNAVDQHVMETAAEADLEALFESLPPQLREIDREKVQARADALFPEIAGRDGIRPDVAVAMALHQAASELSGAGAGDERDVADRWEYASRATKSLEPRKQGPSKPKGADFQGTELDLADAFVAYQQGA